MYAFFSTSLARRRVFFGNIIANTFNSCGKIKKINKIYTDGAIVRCLSFSRQRYDVVKYSEEVEDARQRNLPIVALESTIITHGMPYPDNFSTARRVQEIVREKGVVPATIAIIGGKIHVGMSDQRLEELSECARPINDNAPRDDSRKATKCSRRDIARVISEGTNGGTTVGGTMTIARIAGIRIMATGGIGGVHRGAENNFDVSSDLTELGRNRVAVVCAGVKAILDVPKTLEYLETQGVPVITIGDTDNFPAFYCRATSTNDPVKSPFRVNDARAAAKVLSAQESLGLENGMLFAVPIPEAQALDSEIVELTIREALAMAELEGICGKDVTPYLLEQLNRLTSGGFLKANQALVENNARVAAEMALAFESLRRNDNEGWSSSTTKTEVQRPSSHRVQASAAPVVIGGAIFDTVLHTTHQSITLDGRTHRAKMRRESHGGVGRNVAAAMIALGLDNTKLVTVVGDDAAGRSILAGLGAAGETVEVLADAATPRYTAILDENGECALGIGETDTFEAIGCDLVAKQRATLEKAGLVVLDGNLPRETMRASVELAAQNGIPVWYEPTDVSKASKIFEACSEWIDLTGSNNPEESSVVRFISPNVNELLTIAKYLNIVVPNDEQSFDPEKLKDEKDDVVVQRISGLAKRIARVIPIVITTLGRRGILVTRRGTSRDPLFVPARMPTATSKRDAVSNTARNVEPKSRWYPTAPVKTRNAEDTFSVSGCGDCLAAAIITGSYNGLSEVECVKFALEAAAVSLKSYEPVPRALEKLRTLDPTNSSGNKRPE